MEGGRGGCVVRACLEHIGGFGHGPGSRSISNEISHGQHITHSGLPKPYIPPRKLVSKEFGWGGYPSRLVFLSANDQEAGRCTMK